MIVLKQARTRAVCRFAALLVPCVLGAACAPLRPDTTKAETHALAPVLDTPSARYLRAELDAHAGLSGFRLLTRNNNALMSRVALADQAQHSIDLQYYIFNNDATGRLLAQRLLAAADRGVRVRILLDDINAGGANDMLDALAMHPNIMVRLFNPFRTRDPSFVSKALQLALDGRRLNRRMHNKSFVVDGWVAVIGGRNIGDEYFDAGSDASFRDLDIVAIGPVVTQASVSFDSYWNCDVAYPLPALRSGPRQPDRLDQERAALARDARAFAQSDYAQAVLEELPHGATADRRGDWFWGSAALVADQPEKIEVDQDEPSLRIGPKLRQLFDAARSEVILISPYFVPGDSGTRYLTGLVQRGVAARVLTNSLAATDEPAVHVGYARYRRALLEAGVQLFELRPVAGEPQPATAGGKSSGVSLHAKAAVIDRRHVFIGSMNMDQRSKLLNTEMGVIVDCPELAQAVVRFFDAATQPDAAFAVELQRNARGGEEIIWRANDDGKPVTFIEEPEAAVGRRLEVSLFGLLPIEQLL